MGIGFCVFWSYGFPIGIYTLLEFFTFCIIFIVDFIQCNSKSNIGIVFVYGF